MKPRTLGVSMAARSQGLSVRSAPPNPKPMARAAGGGFTATLEFDEAGITRASAGICGRREPMGGCARRGALAHREA